MSGELHEISLAIGRLEAQNQEALTQRREIWVQLNDINRKVSTIEPLEKKFQKMETELLTWTDARSKAAGAFIVLSVMAGALGFVGALVKAWLFGR